MAILQKTGITGSLSISSSGIRPTTSASLFNVNGYNGRLLSVVDTLSGSLFSVNSIAGLPIFEVFSNNRVVAGKYAANDFVISGSRVGIGTSSPSAKLAVAGAGTGLMLVGNSGFTGNFTAITLNNGTATTSYNLLSSPTDTTLYINRPSGGNINFREANSDQMILLSGGNLGIGTTSPSGKLEIRTNAGSNYLFTGTSTSGYTTTFTMDDTASYFGHDSSVRSLTLRTDSTARLTITGNGNVGIGTSSPGAKLHVSSSTALPAGLFQGYVGIGTNNTSWPLQVRRIGGAGSLAISVDNYLGALTRDVLLKVAPDNPGDTGGFLFRSFNGADVNAMVITAVGNVGIGTTSPSAKLDVAGSNTNGYSLLLRSGDAFDGTDSVQIAFGYNNTTDYRHSIRTRHNSAASSGNNIDFYLWKYGTDAAGTLGSQFAMTMQGDGNVGIGTTSPNTLLDVRGIIQGQNYQIPDTGATAQWVKIGRLTLPQNGYTAHIRAYLHDGYNALNTQDFYLDLYFKTSNGASVDTNGFAGNSWYTTTGFNATNPTPKWIANAAGTSATYYTLYLYLPNFTNRSHYVVELVDGGTWLNEGVIGQSDPGVGSSTVCVSSPGFNVLQGNVGIGTTNSTSKTYILDSTDSPALGTLRVRSTGGNSSICIDANSTSQYAYFTLAQGGTGKFEMGVIPTTSDFYLNPNVQVGATNPAIFIKKADGNVGINTTSPSQKLHVEGNIKVNGDSGIGAENTGGSVHVTYCGGGQFATTTQTTTGYLKITLPQTWTSTMMHFYVDVYEYATGKTKSFAFSGYNYTGNTSWYNCSAYLTIDDDDATYTARFGHDGSKCAIYIEDGNGASSDWTYVQVTVRDFHAGYTNYDYSQWASGWDVSFTATLGTITVTRTCAKTITTNNISGTSNYIPKFTGTNSIGNSAIYDSSGNILIGQTAASSGGKLSVAGAMVSSNYPYVVSVYENTTTGLGNGGGIGFSGKNAGGYESIQGAVQAVFETNGTLATDYKSGLRFLTRAANTSLLTERVRIDSDGYVGIGTTSPSNKLTVAGSVDIGNQGLVAGQVGVLQIGSTANNYLFTGGTWTSDIRAGILANCADNWEMAIHDSGVRVASALAFFGGVSNNYIQMGRDIGWGVSPVVFAGSVGIGTTGPGYALDINGVTRFRDVVRFKNAAWNLSDDGQARFWFDTSGRTYFGSGNGYEWRSNADAGLMYLLNGGNLGIGTTSPAALLNIRASAPTSTGTVTTGTNLLIDSNTSNYITFRNTGDNATYAGLTFLDNNTGGYVVFRNYASNDVIGGSDCMIYGTYQDHIFQNGTSETINGKIETLRIKQNGSVGIGANSPSAKLHISSSTTTALRIETKVGSGTDTQIEYVGPDTHSYALGIDNSDGNKFKISYAASRTPPNLGTNDRFVIQTDGKIGIGSTAPEADLSIVDMNLGRVTISSTTYYGVWLTGGTSATDYSFLSSPSDTNLYVNAPSTKGIYNQINNINRFIITTDFVRINNDPNGANNNIFQRWSYVSTDSYYLDLKQTVTAGVVRYNFSMVNNGTAYNDILILDRGNVGIGSTSPAYKLDVTGTAAISGDVGIGGLIDTGARLYVQGESLTEPFLSVQTCLGNNSNSTATYNTLKGYLAVKIGNNVGSGTALITAGTYYLRLWGGV